MIKFGQWASAAVGRSVLPRASAQFWALCLLLTACFLIGGSARGEVASLMILRPLAILILGFALWRLQRAQLRAHWFIIAMALAVIALPALQLIPMPPLLWHQLPGRNLIAEIDRVAELGQVWRPLSLTPPETRNALFAALVPFAALVLGVQLAHEELYRLLVVVLLLGGTSAVIGLLQTLGDPDGPLYFYATTNNGLAVGLFANRNHQGVLLAMMLPLLAVLASARPERGGVRPEQIAAILGGLCLLPLLLVTGSRVGLICGVAGLLAVPALIRPAPRGSHRSDKPGKTKSRLSQPLWIAGGFGLLALALITLTIMLGRGAAWDRLVATGSSSDFRVQILPTLKTMIARYFPFGTGMGSFERVYQVHEPDALLSPIYMNHAHNDWLEVLLNAGVAGVLLLVAAIAAFGIRAARVFSLRAPQSREIQYARVGLVLVILAAIASISDYPLRTPSLASLFVVAVLWASCPLPKTGTVLGGE